MSDSLFVLGIILVFFGFGALLRVIFQHISRSISEDELDKELKKVKNVHDSCISKLKDFIKDEKRYPSISENIKKFEESVNHFDFALEKRDATIIRSRTFLWFVTILFITVFITGISLIQIGVNIDKDLQNLTRIQNERNDYKELYQNSMDKILLLYPELGIIKPFRDAVISAKNSHSSAASKLEQLLMPNASSWPILMATEATLSDSYLQTWSDAVHALRCKDIDKLKGEGNINDLQEISDRYRHDEAFKLMVLLFCQEGELTVEVCNKYGLDTNSKKNKEGTAKKYCSIQSKSDDNVFLYPGAIFSEINYPRVNRAKSSIGYNAVQ